MIEFVREGKRVKRKKERRNIMIGTEQRKNRNDGGGVDVYYFTIVKENIIRNINIYYWNRVLSVVVW